MKRRILSPLAFNFALALFVALFVWSSALGQSAVSMVVSAHHQVPVVVSLDFPTGITTTVPVQITVWLDIESTVSLTGSEVISTNVVLGAEVVSEQIEASVDVQSAVDSQATVVVSASAPSAAVQSALPATARQNANLRECPNTSCDIVGFARAGQELAVVGQSEDQEWYQLSGGEWIAAFLVDNAPVPLPVVTSTSEITPTVTPSPVPSQESPAPGPGISVTEPIPACGTNENLDGEVNHAQPEAYKVAVYINVRGWWWTKPYRDTPLTSIRSDGTWTTDITTGGEDPLADQIAAFLVPDGYYPPVVSREQVLPQDLYDSAVDYILLQRPCLESTPSPIPTLSDDPPPPSTQITVTAAGGEASGEVGPASVCNPNYKVALYAKTDKWYVQPFGDSRRDIAINEDCTWRSSTHAWNELVAFLVPVAYDPPEEILEPSCPPLEPGVASGILAAACFP